MSGVNLAEQFSVPILDWSPELRFTGMSMMTDFISSDVMRIELACGIICF
jgi:hypothetical protein